MIQGICSGAQHPRLCCLQSYSPEQMQEIHIFHGKKESQLGQRREELMRILTFCDHGSKVWRGEPEIHVRYLIYAVSSPYLFLPHSFSKHTVNLEQQNETWIDGKDRNHSRFCWLLQAWKMGLGLGGMFYSLMLNFQGSPNIASTFNNENIIRLVTFSK